MINTLKILKTIPNIANILAGILASVALALVCFEVFGRYFAPHILPDWGTEIIVYLTVWALFLAVCGLPMERGHVAANFIVDRLSPQKRYYFEMLSSLCSLIFSAILVWYGYEVVEFAIFIGDEGESTLRFPKWIYYLCIPVGMALNFLAYMVRIYTDINTSAENLFSKQESNH